MPRTRSMAKAKAEKLRQTKLDFFSAQGFQKFPELPAELRQMIIREALLEDEKKRPAKVVLFDHNTYRVSPLRSLSENLSPMLSVNAEFRDVALKIYVPLQVFDLGPPQANQYGHTEDWMDEYGNVEYSLGVAEAIDVEATEGSSAEFEGHAGHVYVRPGTDIFLSGLIPRQINNCPLFCNLLDSYEDDDSSVDDTWAAPICFITERLPLSACAKIACMRHFVWDPEPNCPHCGDYHEWHCSNCFLSSSRGQSLLSHPKPEIDVFSNVEHFGFYVMGGDTIPETIMLELASSKHTMKYLETILEARHITASIVAFFLLSASPDGVDSE